jgi:hypothetical protein
MITAGIRKPWTSVLISIDMKYEEEIRFKVDIFIFLGYRKAKGASLRLGARAWPTPPPPGTTAPDFLFLC